jgi:hypothetical protein
MPRETVCPGGCCTTVKRKYCQDLSVWLHQQDMEFEERGHVYKNVRRYVNALYLFIWKKLK